MYAHEATETNEQGSRAIRVLCEHGSNTLVSPTTAFAHLPWHHKQFRPTAGNQDWQSSISSHFRTSEQAAEACSRDASKPAFQDLQLRRSRHSTPHFKLVPTVPVPSLTVSDVGSHAPPFTRSSSGGRRGMSSCCTGWKIRWSRQRYRRKAECLEA